MSRRSYRDMMLADPQGFHDPLERIDFAVRMHFLQDQERHRRLSQGLRTALMVQATKQVQECLEAWEQDDWDDARRDRHVRDAEDLVHAQVDTLDRYMREAVRTRAWDAIYTQCNLGEDRGAAFADVKHLRETLWSNALATVDWDGIVNALTVGKCDEHVAEAAHPTQASLYWAMVRRQIAAQVLDLDEAKCGPVDKMDPRMCAQEHPSQWSAHDLSTLLGDRDRDKTPRRRQAIRRALHFAAQSPHGLSSTLTLWAQRPQGVP